LSVEKNNAGEGGKGTLGHLSSFELGFETATS